MALRQRRPSTNDVSSEPEPDGSSGPRRPRIFYGWWIVAAGSGVQMLVGGLMMHVFGAYIAEIGRDYGWNRTTLSGAFSLSRAESGIFGPLQGWMIDRFGPRAVMRVGLVLLALGFFSFSRLDSILTFYLTFALMSVGASLGGFLSITVAVINWFNRSRSRALGASQIGMSLGGLAAPLVILAIVNVGWRETAMISGAVVLLIGLPLTQLIRHRPEDHGYTVDGDDPDAEPDETPQAVARRNRTTSVDFTWREALRTRAFWMISLGHASALLVVSAVMVHLFLHLTDSLGYSEVAAAQVIALMTVMQIAGQLGGGYLGDRLNKQAIVTACMLSHMVGLLLVAHATSILMVLGFTVFHGLAWGTRGPLMQAIRADYFGRASFGTIMGFSSMIIMMGMMSGPVVAGLLYDSTGSYELGFTILALLAGIGSIFFVLGGKPEPPQRDSTDPPASPPVEPAGVPSGRASA